MEFHEKLQELRKSRGLTQEELAEDLYVSRTAISKWELGRGYPSIDSLKEISKYFSVTIDDLLSSERLLLIAEKKINQIWDSCVYSVNLFAYTQTTRANRLLYWIMYILLILMGIIKVSVTKFRIERYMQIITGISMVLNIMLVLILAITREAYALIVVFLLLVIKGVLILSLQSK